ncbi:efflux transporter outer membrane subunit [Niveispirillum sp. BGYR6]|uniref:efflux transporter outer membrane subunit n=1 Tax=Niveispirillum sp. BGYR6 TaxID=2971249 RepID=UPI0022B968D3|nr:efflux transporter outer membrane subunit [Niveispirillum sp. BGYR6]MDG5497833.1 efflux transporter outer membrane subunit [Niveispirillum sp. BGYR6]
MKPHPLILSLGLILPLAACTAGPDYQKPQAPLSNQFKEQPEGWRQANPAGVAQDQWWSLFANAELDGLMRQVEVGNQNLAAVEAAYRQALAAVDSADAAFFPTVSASAAASRARSNSSSTLTGRETTSYRNSRSLTLGASWAPDIWGSVRRASEQAGATAQASAAELAAARLSAQTALATAYFQLRSLDSQSKLLAATVAAYQRSLEIARNRRASDLGSSADVAQAQAQYDSARANAIALTSQRAALEHAIAVLVGKPPADFSLPVADLPTQVPAVPAALPASLLERRPDIVAAERRMAAANAKIGIASAAYFPNVTLSASSGFSASALGDLLRASNFVWSVGPQLAENLFDGGARDAAKAQAIAAYDQQVASYRQTVLTSLQAVEDQLSSLNALQGQIDARDQAVTAATEAERIVLNQYKAGTVGYTEVITAQTAALSARQSALTVRQNRLTATVALLEALGGGWQAAR